MKTLTQLILETIRHPIDSNYKADEYSLDPDYHAVRYDGNLIGGFRKIPVPHLVGERTDNDQYTYKAEHDPSGDTYDLASTPDEALDWLKDRHEHYVKWGH